MKSYEKLRQVQEHRHLPDKEIYRGINMAQSTFSSKKLGIKRFWEPEKRAIEKQLKLPEGYLDDDALPIPVIDYSRPALGNIVVAIQGDYIKLDGRIDNIEVIVPVVASLVNRVAELEEKLNGKTNKRRKRK